MELYNAEYQANNYYVTISIGNYQKDLIRLSNTLCIR